MKTVACFLLTVFSTFAADSIAGKWFGKMHVAASGEQDVDVAAVLVLQQDGSALTGTLTPAGKDPQPIQQGRIDGDKVSFELPPSSKFAGTLVGDTLRLSSEFRFAERQIIVKLDLKRE